MNTLVHYVALGRDPYGGLRVGARCDDAREEFPMITGAWSRDRRCVTCERCMAKHILGDEVFALRGVTCKALDGWDDEIAFMGVR